MTVFSLSFFSVGLAVTVCVFAGAIAVAVCVFAGAICAKVLQGYCRKNEAVITARRAPTLERGVLVGIMLGLFIFALGLRLDSYGQINAGCTSEKVEIRRRLSVGLTRARSRPHCWTANKKADYQWTHYRGLHLYPLNENPIESGGGFEWVFRLYFCIYLTWEPVGVFNCQR